LDERKKRTLYGGGKGHESPLLEKGRHCKKEERREANHEKSY